MFQTSFFPPKVVGEVCLHAGAINGRCVGKSVSLPVRRDGGLGFSLNTPVSFPVLLLHLECKNHL